MILYGSTHERRRFCGMVLLSFQAVHRGRPTGARGHDQAIRQAPDPPERGIIWGMIGRLKTYWQEFRGSEPGHRFQDRYQRRRQDEQGHVFLRIFNIGFGSVLAVGSLALAPLPGPGFLTVFLGLAIVAGELLYAARFLDWSELKVRSFARFVRDVWRMSALGKVLVVVVAFLFVDVFVYLAYRLLFGG